MNGGNCPDDSITEEATEMGQCFTFNKNSDNRIIATNTGYTFCLNSILHTVTAANVIQSEFKKDTKKLYFSISETI